MSIKTGIGQDSHAFETEEQKPLKLGGVLIPDSPGLKGNSDADVLLHAICNAISGVSGVPVLGPVTDKMCAAGVINGASYVREALKTLTGYRVTHVSASLECRRPKLLPFFPDMRRSIAEIMDLSLEDVAITATTGEGLTAFGRAEGIQALVIVTAEKI